MEIRFPPHPLYEGWMRPHRVESTIDGLELKSGTPPKELAGTWYRNGPDRQFPPMTGDDFFADGEGMVHMFRFKDGFVSYRSRWVRNARFVAQQDAKRSLFGDYRDTFHNDPLAEGIHQGTANTNAIFHAGRLLALKEDDMPYELDPDTLETIGRFEFDGQIKAERLSAHPKIDVVNDRHITMSFFAKGDGTTDVAYYEIDRHGQVVDEIWFHAPYPCQVHDFAFTQNHVVIPFFPAITDLDDVRRGRKFYQYDKSLNSHVAVLKRGGTADDIRWFTGPPKTAPHMVNAFEDGSKVHLDLILYDGNFFQFAWPPLGSDELGPPITPSLSRLTMDLAANVDTFSIIEIVSSVGEAPRTDDRWQGYPYRHAWYMGEHIGVSGDQAGQGPLCHVDVTTGKVSRWLPGPRDSIHEPQFIPRTPDSPEGDGWIIALVNRFDQNEGELALFDATDVEKGPIAAWHMPARVRLTFHGTWVPEETLRTHQYNMKRVPAEA